MECAEPISKEVAVAAVRLSIIECVSARSVLRMNAMGKPTDYNSFSSGCALGIAMAVELALTKEDCVKIASDVDRMINLGKFRTGHRE